MQSPSNIDNQQQESPILLEQLEEEIRKYVFNQDLAVIEDQICDSLCGTRQLPTGIKKIVEQDVYKKIPNLAKNVRDVLILTNDELARCRIISSSSFYRSLIVDSDVVISPNRNNLQGRQADDSLLHSACSIALPNSPDNSDNELRPGI